MKKSIFENKHFHLLKRNLYQKRKAENMMKVAGHLVILNCLDLNEIDFLNPLWLILYPFLILWMFGISSI